MEEPPFQIQLMMFYYKPIRLQVQTNKTYHHGWLCTSAVLWHPSYDLLQMARARAEIWLGEVRI